MHGRYQIVALLGAGATGEVRGRDRKLGHEIAATRRLPLSSLRQFRRQSRTISCVAVSVCLLNHDRRERGTGSRSLFVCGG